MNLQGNQIIFQKHDELISLPHCHGLGNRSSWGFDKLISSSTNLRGMDVMYQENLSIYRSMESSIWAHAFC